MSQSNRSLEERIGQLERSRHFWKRLALGQQLLVAVVIVAGITISSLMAVRARQAEMIAREEARRAQEAADEARKQAEEAAQAAEAERRAREKDKK
jgi:hypothetical protein